MAGGERPSSAATRITPPGRDLALPRAYTLSSEYDIWQNWDFDVANAQPRVRSAIQPVTQLLVDPEEWTVEASRLKGDSWNRTGHFEISFVFYSPSREQPNFTRGQLGLNMRDVINPEIFEEYYNGGSTDVRIRNHRRVNLRPPFSILEDPENTTSPYMVNSVTLRNFNLQSKTTPITDPRRFIAELTVEDPVVALRLLLDDGTSKAGKYIQKNRDRIPPIVLERVEARLSAIQEHLEGLYEDLP